MRYWPEWHMYSEGSNPGENQNNENEAVEGEGDPVSSVEVVQDFTPVIDELKEIQKMQYAGTLIISFLVVVLLIRGVFYEK